jgi:hypothetical protein
MAISLEHCSPHAKHGGFFMTGERLSGMGLLMMLLHLGNNPEHAPRELSLVRRNKVDGLQQVFRVGGL